CYKEEASIICGSELIILAEHIEVMTESEENSSQRHADEVLVAQEERPRSEKSTEEEED
ncbi:hypothetical protein HAX54_046581, partial [Datura stramonium]|nr:hypothetical protein [Datura stramonium]